MRVVCTPHIPAAFLTWRSRRGELTHTVICKATYSLEPVESVLAEHHEPLYESDQHWEDSEQRSLRAASDLAPFKRRADVVVVGAVFAPAETTSRRVIARIAVGDIDKSIVAHSERSVSREGVLVEGRPFSRMPLVYERARGGDETDNPVGRTSARDSLGKMHLPNLQPIAFEPEAPDFFVPSIGLGPIAAIWPSRTRRLGGHAALPPDALLERPEDFDGSFFNVAPADQQLDELPSNAHLVLESLHAEHARLVTRLPGHRARALVDIAGIDLNLVCDTLWIDTERAICTLTWRGSFRADNLMPDERIIVALESADMHRTADLLRKSVPSGDETLTLKPRKTIALPDRGALPFGNQGSAPASFSGSLAGTPFQSASGKARASSDDPPPPASRPARAQPLQQQGTYEFAAHDSVDIAPPKPTAQPPARASQHDPSASAFASPAQAYVAAAPPSFGPYPPSSGQPSGATPRPPLPPPAVPAPVTHGLPSALGLTSAHGQSAMFPSPPGPVSSRSMHGSGPRDEGASRSPSPPLATHGPLAATPLLAVTRLSSPSLNTQTPAYLSSPRQPATVQTHVAHDARAASRGVASASDAAARSNVEAVPKARPAESAPVAPAPPKRPRTFVDLLWFDDAAVERIRAQASWSETLKGTLKSSPWLTEAASSEAAKRELEPQKYVARAMTRVTMLDASGVQQAIVNAVDDDGYLVRPLVVVEGDLAFVYSPLEALKISLALAEPLGATDKKLKEQLDAATDVARPERKSTIPMIESVLARVRSAFQAANKVYPPNYLETTTERVLIEERGYLKRVVLGGPKLVATLSPPNGGALSVYLPEELASRLPLLPRFRVRLIAEPHARQDASDGEGTVLVGLALGRVVLPSNVLA